MFSNLSFNVNENWGLKPVLFRIGKLPVEAYPVFILLAIVAGALVYFLQLKKDNIRNSNAVYIVIFALVGGAVGSKLPILIMYWKQINSGADPLNIVTSGRTIVGGLIGGFLGTFLAKKLFRIKERMGNQIAIPVSTGMAVGRVGCLLRGCCYGTATSLPWGIDFGDGIKRHPTQVYEIIFDVLLTLVLIHIKRKKELEPGMLFKIFLNSYLSFRFLLEFIRVEKIAFWGLTDFQLLCLVSIIFINRKYIISVFRRREA